MSEQKEGLVKVGYCPRVSGKQLLDEALGALEVSLHLCRPEEAVWNQLRQYLCGCSVGWQYEAEVRGLVCQLKLYFSDRCNHAIDWQRLPSPPATAVFTRAKWQCDGRHVAFVGECEVHQVH